MRTIILAGLLLAPVVALAQQHATNGWQKEFEVLQRLEHECLFLGDAAACPRMLAAFERVRQSADITEGLRHEFEGRELRVLRAYGDNQREQGDLATAMQTYGIAWAAMMQHNADGKHMHMLVENLALYASIADGMAASGDTEGSDRIFSEARAIADYVWQGYDTLSKDERGLALLGAAALDGEQAEARWAQTLSDRSAAGRIKGDAAAADTLSQASADAYAYAIRRLEGADKLQQGHFMEDSRPERYARYSLARADELMLLNRTQDAIDASNAAFTMASSLVGEKKPDSLLEEIEYRKNVTLAVRAMAALAESQAAGGIDKARETFQMARSTFSATPGVLDSDFPEGWYLRARLMHINARWFDGSWLDAVEAWSKVKERMDVRALDELRIIEAQGQFNAE
jgi:hypothetical protein